MFRNVRSITRDEALPGRGQPMQVMNRHYVNGHPLCPPFPDGMQLAMFGLGCFWGAERTFWLLPGVYSTAVGYAGGFTPNPTYREVCTGMTGHNEVVRVVFAPDLVSYASMVKLFWESHDPTQGMRQGNDIGTQYRSGIYVYDEEQACIAEQTKTSTRPHCNARAMRSSPRKFSMHRNFFMQRITISSIWPRTRTAIAAWEAQELN